MLVHVRVAAALYKGHHTLPVRARPLGTADGRGAVQAALAATIRGLVITLPGAQIAGVNGARVSVVTIHAGGAAV